jgi:hypothetical protein
MGTWRTGVAVLLLLSLPATAGAQVVRVAGTIRDESGRPIRGATIVASNPDHSPSTLTASSDERGRFGIIGFRRGAWTFTIEAPGFERAEIERLIAPGRSNPLDVQLRRGQAPPPPPPLAGVRASDVQQEIDGAEKAAAEGDLESAIAAYEALGRRVPALTLVHLRLGELHERAGDPARALDAYRRLAAGEPGHAAARAAIARLAGGR